MKTKLLFANIVIVVLLFSACTGGSKTSCIVDGGDTLEIRYATNLKIVRFSDYTVATVRNPWDTLKTLHTYVLVDKQKPVPEHLPEGTVVRVPVEKALVYSVVHGGLLDELGAIGSIAGVCNMAYFKMPKIQKLHGEGKIMDCGNGMNPDIEKVIALSPDAIMLSPFENNGGYGRIGKLNIPIIECADYMETSPLGRAEWMLFYGMLAGREKQADSLFASVEKEYMSVRDAVKNAENRPTVLSDLRYGSAWYIPGGNSTTGKLYADAGADYIFSDLKNSGSVPMSFEAVFDAARDADYWFVKYNQKTDKTYKELKTDYAPYSRFKAFKEKHIYGCNTNRIPYYEELTFHPEKLLKDIAKIIHPELLEGYVPEYFSNLADE